MRYTTTTYQQLQNLPRYLLVIYDEGMCNEKSMMNKKVQGLSKCQQKNKIIGEKNKAKKARNAHLEGII